MVTTNSEADMMGLRFLGLVGDDKEQVRGFAAGGHGSDGDEEECVGAFGCGDATGGESLGKVSDLFGAAAFPDVAVRALEECLVLNPFTRVHMECSMCSMRGVIADGHGVNGAGGSKGCFDVCMLLRRGTVLAATAAGPGARLVGGVPNSRWRHSSRWGHNSRQGQTVGGGHKGAWGGWVGTLRAGAPGRLERWRRGRHATVVHSEAMGPCPGTIAAGAGAGMATGAGAATAGGAGTRTGAGVGNGAVGGTGAAIGLIVGIGIGSCAGGTGAAGTLEVVQWSRKDRD
jgi:hypothetical protein